LCYANYHATCGIVGIWDVQDVPPSY
jgi:hypothetical protein